MAIQLREYRIAAMLRPAAATHRFTLVLLHGYGGSASECLAALPLRQAVSPDVLVLLPDGTQRANLKGGNAWYTLSADPNRNSIGAEVASARVRRAVERWAVEHRCTHVPTAFAGFSQGAAVAIHLALTWPYPVSWTLALNGAYHFRPCEPLPKVRESRQFHLVGGTEDDFVSVDAMETCCTQLRRLGHSASMVSLHGVAHELSLKSWRHLRRAKYAGPLLHS
jgi:predicted esterase